MTGGDATFRRRKGRIPCAQSRDVLVEALVGLLHHVFYLLVYRGT